jgi:hypothetical protein
MANLSLQPRLWFLAWPALGLVVHARTATGIPGCAARTPPLRA